VTEVGGVVQRPVAPPPGTVTSPRVPGTVSRSTTRSSGELPRTGADVLGAALLGTGLTAAGAEALRRARRGTGSAPADDADDAVEQPTPVADEG
jgi:hypothetical protein